LAVLLSKLRTSKINTIQQLPFAMVIESKGLAADLDFLAMHHLQGTEQAQDTN
jgi:hypothetical protein